MAIFDSLKVASGKSKEAIDYNCLHSNEGIKDIVEYDCKFNDIIDDNKVYNAIVRNLDYSKLTSCEELQNILKDYGIIVSDEFLTSTVEQHVKAVRSAGYVGDWDEIDRDDIIKAHYNPFIKRIPNIIADLKLKCRFNITVSNSSENVLQDLLLKSLPENYYELKNIFLNYKVKYEEYPAEKLPHGSPESMYVCYKCNVLAYSMGFTEFPLDKVYIHYTAMAKRRGSEYICLFNKQTTILCNGVNYKVFPMICYSPSKYNYIALMLVNGSQVMVICEDDYFSVYLTKLFTRVQLQGGYLKELGFQQYDLFEESRGIRVSGELDKDTDETALEVSQYHNLLHSMDTPVHTIVKSYEDKYIDISYLFKSMSLYKFLYKYLLLKGYVIISQTYPVETD